MKKSQIKVGGFYVAMVSDKLVTVRVDKIREDGVTGYGSTARDATRYDVTNMSTGRTTTFRSAAKFRSETTWPKKVQPLSEPERELGVIIGLLPPKKQIEVHSLPVNALSGPGEDTPSVFNVKPVGGQQGGPSAHDAKGEAEAKAVTDAMENPCRDIPDPGLTPAYIGGKPTGRTLADAFRKTPPDNSPHLIVEARAGTGKTTTLVEGIGIVLGIPSKMIPSPQQKAVWDAMAMSKGKVKSICFVAFNKSIADELKARVPEGCQASTMHSMGFKAVRNAFGNGIKVNEYRVQDIISELLGRDTRELRRTKGEMIQAVEHLVGLCKMNLIGGQSGPCLTDWTDELDQLCSHYEVELAAYRSEVFNLVPRVLERCLDVAKDNSIDYSDMIWLPVALNLAVFKYDMLLVDEAQDLNRCQQALAKMAGRRLILCGDPKQAIYGFAGADSESMNRMRDELGDYLEGPAGPNGLIRGVITLPLTVTRRCGKAIVREANKIVPDFAAFETNPEGEIKRMPFKGHDRQPVEGGIELSLNYRHQAQDGDMVLCRVNAPLVSECFKFIKAGRKANIQGRDVGKGLISTITKMKAANVVDLTSRLSDWLHGETQKENVKRNPSEQRLIALQDRYDCLMCFLEGATTVEAVIAKIESIFTDNKTAPGIRLSSVHKAKGLEAQRVFILLPDGAGMPHPMAKSAWQREQEMNLKYVAITRAISELVYVS